MTSEENAPSLYSKWLTVFLCGMLGCLCFRPAGAEELQIGTFQVDASPAIGSPLAYDPTREITEPLSLRGIVLVPEQQKPIVLCVVDWLGVANAAQDAFREAIANGTQTTVDRVVVHALHQHDAPRCDLSAAAILDEFGGSGGHYDQQFIHQCVDRAAQAAGAALNKLSVVKSVRSSKAQVYEVASNRRMLGPDGKVHVTRYTACKDPKVRALPEGVIDPWLRTLTFTGTQGDLAVLTFYATHPQSYYRTGGANPDFPGMARNARQKDTGVFHLHFNGAGGNIGAGKYNDGSTQNRQVLADRVEDAMRRAHQVLETQALSSIEWRSVPIQLPPGAHLKESVLLEELRQESTPEALRLNAAKKVAYLRRVEQGKTISVSCLQLGDNQILFLPGELFVEYQLAAQAMRPEANVMVAAYGEYGTGYIGTRVAYPQGGYEVSERASNVGPEAEAILLDAMRTVLKAADNRVHASDFTETFGELPR
ncbi:MAG: hypothetical protein NXI32_06360 [bacterium]|nr:hypothetical protein [bacterium]